MNLDDGRILTGEVSDAEKEALERRLLRMSAERAQAQEGEIIAVQDVQQYAEILQQAGLRQQEPDCYILTDHRGNIRDLTGVALYLLDTEEGLFYAKLLSTQQPAGFLH